MIEAKITIGDILTDAEIKKAKIIYRRAKTGQFAARLRDRIILPNIERINNKVGQECDPLYLAYAVEYAMMMAEKHGAKNAANGKQPTGRSL